MSRFLAGVAAVLALLAVLLGVYTRHLAAQNALLAAQNDEAQQTIRQLREAERRNEALLAERERERELLAAQAASWERRFRDAERRREDVRRWGAAPLPGPVVDVVRDADGARRQGAAAGGAHE